MNFLFFIINTSDIQQIVNTAINYTTDAHTTIINIISFIDLII